MRPATPLDLLISNTPYARTITPFRRKSNSYFRAEFYWNNPIRNMVYGTGDALRLRVMGCISK